MHLCICTLEATNIYFSVAFDTIDYDILLDYLWSRTKQNHVSVVPLFAVGQIPKGDGHEKLGLVSGGPIPLE